jgi:ribonuclease HI
MTGYIFTDGAWLGNTKTGAWACHVSLGEIGKCYYGWHKGKTCNQMEMLALIKAFEICAENPDDQFYIYSDSQYALRAFTGAQKKTTTNEDLISKGNALWPKNAVVAWVKGHSACAGNDFVDSIAQKCARLKEPPKRSSFETKETFMWNKAFMVYEKKRDVVFYEL